MTTAVKCLSMKKPGRRIRSFIGQRFGTYVVTRRGPNRYTSIDANGYERFQTTWVCQCDCGRKNIRPSNALKAGDRCQMCFAKSRRLPDAIASKRALWQQYRRVAKYKGIHWNLSEGIFFELTQGNCHYCGKSPTEEPITSVMPTQDYRTGENRKILYNGLDRVDSKGPYSIENVVTCCGVCNHAKFTLDYSVFMRWIQRLKGASK